MAVRAAARKTDLCTGHGCYPPRPSATGSPTVFVNDLAAHRIGDRWRPHCCSDYCHAGSTTSGSNSVFADDIGMSRVSESVSCGSRIMTGSPNVFIED